MVSMVSLASISTVIVLPVRVLMKICPPPPLLLGSSLLGKGGGGAACSSAEKLASRKCE